MAKNLLDIVLDSELLKRSPNALIHFSKYVYTRRGITDKRVPFSAKFHDLERSISEIEKTLAPNEEIALHSLVQLEGKTLYLPFIDFKISKAEAFLDDEPIHIQTYVNIKKYLTEILPKKYLVKNQDFILDSGNSFHGYFDALMDKEQLDKFLAALLLENNTVDHPYEIVDNRWIGHTLRNGFSSLRITNNTSHYLNTPTLVENEKVHI